MLNPYASWIDEDYAIINVEPLENAADLIAQCGGKIAQIVRGDNRPLSSAEVQEILSTMISATWLAALLAEPSTQSIRNE